MVTSGCAHSALEAISGDRDCIPSTATACAPCRASVHVCVNALECARMHSHTLSSAQMPASSHSLLLSPPARLPASVSSELAENLVGSSLLEFSMLSLTSELFLQMKITLSCQERIQRPPCSDSRQTWN